ncbi:MAG: hypothetical protein A3B23_02440 [Candidatus Colwellbacteria bacterium RIFCSPLOWO2_01_FULL_48_10]|uniref:MtN3 and saliva related transmembrane protein n=1 Tax=Candidatus Colwellbacteria bacterium RIFCSPLOWO2_01_FULL_48_10 TaxID=1797690 RepID=A0A1G1Z5M6_9BACT|nr:MAG: hypothetical protein A3B23_02440 [Candidatus Colwellbacteria bacterium RIFCSPLOWO2_01_FULL_48_10]
MNTVSIIGLVAAFCTTVASLHQAIKTIRSRETRGISLWMYVLITFGFSLWLVYGFMIKDVPLIAANSVTLILVIPVLVIKIRNGERS